MWKCVNLLFIIINVVKNHGNFKNTKKYIVYGAQVISLKSQKSTSLFLYYTHYTYCYIWEKCALKQNNNAEFEISENQEIILFNIKFNINITKK